MKRGLATLVLVLVLFLTAEASPSSAPQRADNPNPPDHTVKLISIHHSSGENWLTDDNGGLGIALGQNNYFVSDTNYGWGPAYGDGSTIGDHTDIPDWLSWFRSDRTAEYMQAVFNESGQNSSYTRSLNDPGGENQIIMFKSCFPNSNLEGNPGDPAAPGDGLTVGNAKYVHNEILEYFASRPDKLFIVITAPPLIMSNTSPEAAANARAFNNWLYNDWLAENNYTLPNVAVFDFYNVLTGPENHHRFVDGQIEHVFDERNTSNYHASSDDDHPSAKGNRKATEEFLPLLNVYYHRWADGQPTQPPFAATETQVPPAASGTPDLIADFDGNDLSGSRWETYMGETAGNSLTCVPASDAAHTGTSALKVDFNVAAGSWGTCVLSFETVQDWSDGTGLSFSLHSSRSGLPYSVIVYTGSPDAQETYLDYADTPQDSTGGWASVEIPWSEFTRADWETGAGTPFDKPGQVLEIAFGFDGSADASNSGTVWIDDIRLAGSAAVSTAESPTPQPDGHGSGLPCMGSLLVLLAMAGSTWIFRRK